MASPLYFTFLVLSAREASEVKRNSQVKEPSVELAIFMRVSLNYLWCIVENYTYVIKIMCNKKDLTW